MVVRSLNVALMGAALCSTSVPFTVYAAPPPAHYSIARQDLGQALIELAQEANRNITFAPDLVRGLITVGVTSAENFEAALGALLVNSGLTYRIESDGSATVFRVPPTRGQLSTPPKSSDKPQPPSAQNSAEPVEIEQIMVTAQKRAQPLGQGSLFW